MPVRQTISPIQLGNAFGTPKTGWQVTQDSLVHSGSNRRRKGVYVTGGGFLVHKYQNTFSPAKLPDYNYFGLQGGLAGPVGFIEAQPATAPTTVPTYDTVKASLEPWGVKGWARARPGNPVANAGQFTAELRQLPSVPLLGQNPRERILRGGLKGLPGRMLKRLATFRALGEEYLNIQFGWVPFVQDLKEMYNLTEDIDKRLSQLRRDNGQSLYRRRELGESTTVSVSEHSVSGPFGYLTPTPIIFGGGSSRRTVITTQYQRRWFVGRFKYWVPNIGTPEWDRRARRVLFGANITPSLVYELLPWSWLVDWFSNVGDVLSNMSANAVDNTYAQYAYVMSHSRSEVNTVVNTSWGAGPAAFGSYPAGSATATHVVRTETKVRAFASSFGFGVTWDGLSPYQTSILAAIGVSRNRT